MKINSIDKDARFGVTLGEYRAIKKAGIALASELKSSQVGSFKILTGEGGEFSVLVTPKDVIGMRVGAKLQFTMPKAEFNTHLDFDSFEKSKYLFETEEGAQSLAKMLNLLQENYKSMLKEFRW